MKCPTSEEFFFHTQVKTLCEHDFDSKMHSANTVWRVVHHPRFTLVLNYVMLPSLHLLHMASTHHFHSQAAAMQLASICMPR